VAETAKNGVTQIVVGFDLDALPTSRVNALRNKALIQFQQIFDNTINLVKRLILYGT
jgi:hypothetical protein